MQYLLWKPITNPYVSTFIIFIFIFFWWTHLKYVKGTLWDQCKLRSDHALYHMFCWYWKLEGREREREGEWRQQGRKLSVSMYGHLTDQLDPESWESRNPKTHGEWVDHATRTFQLLHVIAHPLRVSLCFIYFSLGSKGSVSSQSSCRALPNIRGYLFIYFKNIF